MPHQNAAPPCEVAHLRGRRLHLDAPRPDAASACPTTCRTTTCSASSKPYLTAASSPSPRTGLRSSALLRTSFPATTALQLDPERSVAVQELPHHRRRLRHSNRCLSRERKRPEGSVAYAPGWKLQPLRKDRRTGSRTAPASVGNLLEWKAWTRRRSCTAGQNARYATGRGGSQGLAREL